MGQALACRCNPNSDIPELRFAWSWWVEAKRGLARFTLSPVGLQSRQFLQDRKEHEKHSRSAYQETMFITTITTKV